MSKLRNATDITLAVIAVAGAATLAVVAPHILFALIGVSGGPLPRRGRLSQHTKREKDIKVAQAFYYLKRSGKIKMRWNGQDFKIMLTKLGRDRLRHLELATLFVRKPKKWDGKWWQVAADIPTKKYKTAADLMRRKIKEMKFFPLQRTLWFYPYDPRSEIDYLVRHYGVERFVTVMEVSRLDRDDKAVLKRFFKKEKIFPNHE